MKQTIIAATAAALLASATFGVAATSSRTGERERPSPAQMAENAAAMTDARIAALKAGLRMNAEQEKLWPAVETALRDSAAQRAERRENWREKHAERASGQRPDILDSMRERADGLLARGDSLKKLVAAADPLYDSLDPAQKRRFGILLREAQGPHMAEWRRHGHGHERDGHSRGPHRPHDQRPGNDGPAERL